MKWFAGVPAPLFLLLLTTNPLLAQPVAVRYPQGTTHGFLVLRTLGNKMLALGDLEQTVHGDRIESRLVFRFHDGSVDDDRSVYTQDGTFKLVTDHHVQRGPSFPKPMDMSIDVPHGVVVTRAKEDGRAETVATRHMNLPSDLANGLGLVLLTNIRPTAVQTVVPMLVAYHGVRLIHLTIIPTGTLPFRVGGAARPAQEFTVRIDLGGLTGMVAPILGKQPKDLRFLILEQGVPAFVREEGQFFEDGPIWRVDQIGPSSQ